MKWDKTFSVTKRIRLHAPTIAACFSVRTLFSAFTFGWTKRSYRVVITYLDQRGKKFGFSYSRLSIMRMRFVVKHLLRGVGCWSSGLFLLLFHSPSTVLIFTPSSTAVVIVAAVSTSGQTEPFTLLTLELAIVLCYFWDFAHGPCSRVFIKMVQREKRTGIDKRDER